MGKESAAGATLAAPQRQAAEGGAKANLNVADFNLDGVKLAEVSKEPSVADMPRQGAAPERGGPLVRGS